MHPPASVRKPCPAEAFAVAACITLVPSRRIKEQARFARSVNELFGLEPSTGSTASVLRLVLLFGDESSWDKVSAESSRVKSHATQTAESSRKYRGLDVTALFQVNQFAGAKISVMQST